MRNKLDRPERPHWTVELHHVYGGGRRKHSEKYNCVVYLPKAMHTGSNGVHSNKEMRLQIQADMQLRLEDAGWTRGEFRETFGKSYL